MKDGFIDAKVLGLSKRPNCPGTGQPLRDDRYCRQCGCSASSHRHGGAQGEGPWLAHAHVAADGEG